MQYQTLIQLAKAYIRYSGKAINESSFTEKVRIYDTPELNTIDDLHQRLKDIGDANGFVFKLQYVKRADLSILVKELSFPLIVFENKKAIKPLLVLPFDKKGKEKGIAN